MPVDLRKGFLSAPFYLDAIRKLATLAQISHNLWRPSWHTFNLYLPVFRERSLCLFSAFFERLWV